MKKATNLASMREKNGKIILSIINKAPVSRVDIAKKTGLTKAAVSIITEDLIKRNILIEKEGKSDTVGRNPVMLHLNHKAFYIVGINITRQDITVGICDVGGNLLTEGHLDICPPMEAVKKIRDEIYSALSRVNLTKDQIYKVSVATPGPVDSEGGFILNPPNFKAWHNFPIKDRLWEQLAIDTVLENVSSATAMAEKYFGSARDTENFLTLQVDEGIGSGIVINDRLFKGPCELGHTSISYEGERCECGNRGCLEKYASIPHILKNTPYNKWSDVVDNNDEAIMEREAEYLSIAIISANNIFDFDKIVLCGDVIYKPERIIDFISKKIEKNLLSKASLEICHGIVFSKTLIASSVAIDKIFS